MIDRTRSARTTRAQFARPFWTASVIIAYACAAPATAGNVEARWVAPVSGNWTEPVRWSTNPFYPNNGSPAESEYRAIIDATGPDYTVTLAGPVEVASTLIRSPAATLHQSGGTFTVGSLSVGEGGVGHYRMTGGTLNVTRLSVGTGAYSSPPRPGDGLFEQSGGRVNIMAGQTLVGYGVGTFGDYGTGTLLVSGAQSRYVVVPPTSGLQLHLIGVGTSSRGLAQFSNSASVTLARVEVGGNGGAGTVLVDSGAKLAMSDLYVGQSGGRGGDGTLVLAGVGSRLTVGTGDIRIGSIAGGSAQVFVSGGTLTLMPGGPLPTFPFFTVGPTATFTVNGGAVESQRAPYISGGRFIINGGTVTAPSFHLRNAPAGATLALNGGRLTANEVEVTSSNYVQTGGTAVIGLVELAPDEYFSVLPHARLSGGTFNASSVSISSGTFTYQGGTFNGGFLNMTGGRFVAPPGRDKAVRLANLTMSRDARLDLGDNVLLIDSGDPPPIATVRALLRSGYDNGAWNGPGVMSSVAQTNATHGIGYVRPSPLLTALLVAYTRYGDADVDGAVDLEDFNALAENFGTGDDWFDGDFNYDAVVNLRDFNLMAGNFGLTARGPGVSPGDWAALAAAVPEPATGLLVLATLPLLRRRRKS